MTGEFNHKGARRLLFGLLIIATILRLWVAWQPIETLVTKNLPDDAFYYFVIARNVVTLGNASLDGTSVTNGFHPLWLILILPIFGWAQGGNELPIHIALSLASLLDVVSVFLLARLAAKLFRDWRAGLMAGWLYAINPVVILQATNGLETSLGIFTVLLFLSAYQAWLIHETKRNFPGWLAVCGGLMFLARTDSFFLFASTMLAAIWYWKTKESINSVLKIGVGSLIIVSPWLIWSQVNLGKIFQDSGEAIPYILHEKFALAHGAGFVPFISQSIRQVIDPIVWLRGDFTGLPLIIGSLLWLTTLLLLYKRWRSAPQKVEMAIVFPILVASLLLILVHAGFRWYPRPWYFLLASLGFALCLTISVYAHFSKIRVIIWMVASVSVVYIVSGQLYWNVGYYPWQREMLEASRWVSQNLTKDKKIASFNAGILSFYNSPNVINVDGVVNHQAYEAIQSQTLLSYMQTNGADYVIDADAVVSDLYARFMGNGYPDSLQEVASFGELNAELGELRLYLIE